jgi:hypothetical protein
MEYDRIPPEARPAMMLAVMLKSLGGLYSIPEAAFKNVDDLCVVTMSKAEDGSIIVELREGNEAMAIRGWIGSQNHDTPDA